MSRRTVGRTVASLIALVAFAWAGWAAYASAIPKLWVYDGFWMILGSTLAVLTVTPFIWHWPRERSLAIIAVATAVGSVIPLGISAFRHHMPLVARLRGSWALAGADDVGPALVVAFVCLWLALREWTPTEPGAARRWEGRKQT